MPSDEMEKLIISESDCNKKNKFSLLKEEGNDAFKKGDFESALKYYNDALELTTEISDDRAVILKNRAAVQLKLGKYESVVSDCDKALELVPDDPKALFRRCQALEKLERFEEAYRDARMVHKVDPGNKAIQPVLSSLYRIVEDRLAQSVQVENKVIQTFKYVFDIGEDTEKRAKAANNLLVLAKENFGSQALMSSGICEKVLTLFKVEKNMEIILGCIRTIGQLCKDKLDNTKNIINALGIPWFLDLMNSKNTEQITASQYCVQIILESLCGIKEPEKKVSETLLEENRAQVDTILTCLVYSCTSRTLSGEGRDAILQLISRNVHYTAINWADQLVKIKGLQRLMEVASELKEYNYESSMAITDSTRSITSVCLARIYDNMYYDEARARYVENIEDFVKGKLITPELESKVRVVVALTTLLLGPLDVGNRIVAKEGMLQMILVMANSDDVLQQKVACECIIAAATKKDKVRTIIAEGVNILKSLYQSKDNGIRVRALVGLCKLASSGGTDASVRPFADGSTAKLAEACRRFLINPHKDTEMRRWAAEGLSYLTLDADVKEKLIEDLPALKALFELARSGNQAAVYGVVTTLVNLINAYEKQEVMPELVELAKFAKHHVPQEHELDDPDFIAKRCNILAKEGLISGLVGLSNCESLNMKELISRLFNTVCGQQELRGLVVQQGGVKVLLNLAHDGTDKGKRQAAQALSRIGITINPEVGFPGQRCYEVIKPLLAQLHPDCSALENFESLLALCNLASLSDSVRSRIVKEGGVLKIEQYIFEDHEMLRRAATQALTNLISHPDVVQMFEGENDKTKMLVLLSAEEDEDTCKAAAGSLAMLTSISKPCCKKVMDVASWKDTLLMLLANPSVDIQHRGIVIVLNLIQADKQLAEKIIETEVMEVLMALSLLEDDSKKIITTIAKQALDAAKGWNLIKTADPSQPPPDPDELDEFDEEE